MNATLLLLSLVLLYTHAYQWDNTATQITGAAGCVLTLHRDGTSGCTSSRGGDTGVLYYISNQQELDNMLYSTPCDYKYAVLMSYALLETVPEAWSSVGMSSVAAGIIVINTTATAYSPEDTVPNRRYDISQFAWNPLGRNTSLTSIPIPAFTVFGDEGLRLKELAIQNAASESCSFPKSAVYFNAYMAGSGDAELCLRRGQCYPIGGLSVWSALLPKVIKLPENIKHKDWLLVSTAIDAGSLFHDMSPGYHSTVLPMVTVLSVIEALSRATVQWETLPKSVIFGLFNAESYGLVGSRSFYSDINNFVCTQTEAGYCAEPYRNSLEFAKLNVSKLQFVLNVGEVSMPANKTYYFHSDKNDSNSQAIINQLRQLATDTGTVVINDTTTSNTPAHVFTRHSVLHYSDHVSSMNNNNYNSPLDLHDIVQLADVCDSATYVARAVLSYARDNFTVDSNITSVTANCTLMAQLLECLSRNMSCELVRETLGMELPVKPNYYPGVFIRESRVAINVKFLLNYLLTMLGTANQQCENDGDCGTDATVRCVKSKCTTGPVYYHRAVPTSAVPSPEGSTGLWPDFTLSDDVDYAYMESNWPADPTYFITQTLHPSWGLVMTVIGAVVCVALTLLVFQFTKRIEAYMTTASPTLMEPHS